MYGEQLTTNPPAPKVPRRGSLTLDATGPICKTGTASCLSKSLGVGLSSRSDPNTVMTLRGDWGICIIFNHNIDKWWLMLACQHSGAVSKYVPNTTTPFFTWGVYVTPLVPLWHPSWISGVVFLSLAVLDVGINRNMLNRCLQLQDPSLPQPGHTSRLWVPQASLSPWKTMQWAMGKDEMTPLRPTLMGLWGWISSSYIYGVFCLIQTWISRRLTPWHCLMSWVVWWMMNIYEHQTLIFRFHEFSWTSHKFI